VTDWRGRQFYPQNHVTSFVDEIGLLGVYFIVVINCKSFIQYKYQRSLTIPHDTLHHGKRTANKGDTHCDKLATKLS